MRVEGRKGLEASFLLEVGAEDEEEKGLFLCVR